MDIAQNRHPRIITDSVEAICAKCGQIAYNERIIGELQSDGAYAYRKVVTGGYTQKCDSEGIPTGPVIPKCNCEG